MWLREKLWMLFNAFGALIPRRKPWLDSLARVQRYPIEENAGT
jgi:hypothetical protein